MGQTERGGEEERKETFMKTVTLLADVMFQVDFVTGWCCIKDVSHHTRLFKFHFVVSFYFRP